MSPQYCLEARAEYCAHLSDGYGAGGLGHLAKLGDDVGEKVKKAVRHAERRLVEAETRIAALVEEKAELEAGIDAQVLQAVEPMERRAQVAEAKVQQLMEEGAKQAVRVADAERRLADAQAWAEKLAESSAMEQQRLTKALEQVKELAAKVEAQEEEALQFLNESGAEMRRNLDLVSAAHKAQQEAEAVAKTAQDERDAAKKATVAALGERDAAVGAAASETTHAAGLRVELDAAKKREKKRERRMGIFEKILREVLGLFIDADRYTREARKAKAAEFIAKLEEGNADDFNDRL